MITMGDDKRGKEDVNGQRNEIKMERNYEKIEKKTSSQPTITRKETK